MNPVRARRATPADAEPITDIHLVSRAVAMPWLPRVHTDEETLAWVREVVLPGSEVWVAVDGGAPAAPIVGYVAIDGDALDHLYLLPDVRRRGIGTLLLDVAKQASPAQLTLHVFTRNTGARAFYACRGFEGIASDDRSGNEEGLPDMTYRWSPGQ